jgi:Ca2+-binding EF-hand superfamily protein
MDEAYTIFFNNPDQSIGKCEFLNLLKEDKYVSIKALKVFINQIDKDKSLNISFDEFYEFMIETLKIDTLKLKEPLQKKIKMIKEGL